MSLDRELALCDKMLKADERNCAWSLPPSCMAFLSRGGGVRSPLLGAPAARGGAGGSNGRGGNSRALLHRTHKRTLTSIPVQQEAAFAMGLIERNFSNYSAWQELVAATWGQLVETCTELLDLEPESKCAWRSKRPFPLAPLPL